MANILGFFKSKLKDNNVDKKKQETINKLKGYILEPNKKNQENITEEIEELIDDGESENDYKLDSFLDQVNLFEELIITNISDTKIKFKFYTLDVISESELPINTFYEVMIKKGLLNLDEKEESKEVKVTQNKVSNDVNVVML